MSPEGGELFIVDNSDEGWTGLRYLRDWTEIAKSFDIATGFFEIGSYLPATDEMYAATSAICCSVSVLPNGGMPP